jgi:hypothetical protein
MGEAATLDLAELMEPTKISPDFARFSPRFAQGVKCVRSPAGSAGRTTEGQRENRDEDSRPIQRLPDPASTVIV